MPYAELEGIVPPLLAAAAGAWEGALLGSWFALVRRGSGAIRETLVRLGFFAPLCSSDG